jgi:hypothetical protein
MLNENQKVEVEISDNNVLFIAWWRTVLLFYFSLVQPENSITQSSPIQSCQPNHPLRFGRPKLNGFRFKPLFEFNFGLGLVTGNDTQ